MPGIFELLFAAALTAGQSPNPVVIQDRIAPNDAVEGMAGNCGRHRYSIELQHLGSRTVLSVRADDQPVSPSETAKVVQAVTPGYFMYEPKIVECFQDRPNARFRLLIGGPADGGKPIWMSFEVSPQGKVSTIRQD